MPLPNFSDSRIIVIGDAILDCYLSGVATKMSPEAPVPVVLINEKRYVPGGAANVARNLAALGIGVTLAGVIGEDAEGYALSKLLHQQGIQTSLFKDPSRSTTVKTRVVAHHQQMLRYDFENTACISKDLHTKLLNAIEEKLRMKGTMVILSDYGKGVVNRSMCRSLAKLCKAQQSKLFVDPKAKDFSTYEGAYCITPNEHELEMALGVVSPETICRCMSRNNFNHLVVTQGANGATMHTQTKNGKILNFHVDSTAREVYDVTGAGDTFIAVLAACINTKATMRESIKLANMAAGIVVGKLGAATVSRNELVSAINHSS